MDQGKVPLKPNTLKEIHVAEQKPLLNMRDGFLN